MDEAEGVHGLFPRRDGARCCPATFPRCAGRDIAPEVGIVRIPEVESAREVADAALAVVEVDARASVWDGCYGWISVARHGFPPFRAILKAPREGLSAASG